MSSRPNELKLPEHYAAYLMRLWQDSAQGPCRASLQSVHTGAMQLFANLDELFAFLEARTTTWPCDTINQPHAGDPPSSMAQ